MSLVSEHRCFEVAGWGVSISVKNIGLEHFISDCSGHLSGGRVKNAGPVTQVRIFLEKSFG